MTYIHINERGVKVTLRHGEGAAHYQHKPVTDPGFPKQVAPIPEEGTRTCYFDKNLAKNYMKMKEVGVGGGQTLNFTESVSFIAREL